MELFNKIIFGAAFAALPLVSFAQAQAPLTRAEVKSQLAQLEKAGYSIYGSDLDYPNSLKAAEARVAAQRMDSRATSYGGEASGTSAAGAH
jgi:hypothetical protein